MRDARRVRNGRSWTGLLISSGALLADVHVKCVVLRAGLRGFDSLWRAFE